MYSPEEIRKHFDNATLKYLHNKNRGGNSGQKGNRYEDYFAVYKLAQLARDILQAGSSIRFSSQLLAFVDDLIIKHDSNLENYQLKNSSSVSWNQGNHPIQVENIFFRLPVQDFVLILQRIYQLCYSQISN